MKFKLEKASDWEYKSKEVEINYLEELIDFIDKNGRIVLDKEKILIYDDYIE